MQVAAWRAVGKAETVPCRTPDCPGTMRILGRKAVCSVCGAIYQREKPQRSNRLVVELTDLDVARMLAHARRCDPRDFALVGFLASGFRRSEVVGGDDNGVLLPGLCVEDILLEQQGVRVVGKGQSAAIREGRDPKRVLQPVPRIFLEATLSNGFETGPLFGGTNTHQVGDMIREYARLSAVPEWVEVRPHRLRHWYSNAVRKRIGNQGPTALLEWADVMRHSRKAAQSVTVAFYSGELTSFERRLEICLAAFHPVLEQLQSPTFLQSLPAPAPLPTPAPRRNDSVSVRVQGNSQQDESFPKIERGTVSETPNDSIVYTAPPVTVRVSNPVTALMEPAPPVEARRCEWPRGCTEQATVHIAPGWFCETHSHTPFVAPLDPISPLPVDSVDRIGNAQVSTPDLTAAESVVSSQNDRSIAELESERSTSVDPFREEESPEPEPVVETDSAFDESAEVSESEPEPQPVTLPPAPPSRAEIMSAWTDLRYKQRDDLARCRREIKMIWGGIMNRRERNERLRRLLCSSPGCEKEAVAVDPPVGGKRFCEQHCLGDPPDGWAPVRTY